MKRVQLTAGRTRAKSRGKGGLLVVTDAKLQRMLDELATNLSNNCRRPVSASEVVRLVCLAFFGICTATSKEMGKAFPGLF